ncbi:ABC transporter permease [Pseudorhodobacter sp. W20_MBD10_FR17]|uniref:ABC transporter permease n=1 Tax=Pseudorhodobacter sp. W20_MBD10_FR17 TaxID=3240266 RepID=UPI003F9A2C7B
MTQGIKVRLYQLTFFGVILLAWAIVTETGYISRLFLPTLPDLGRKFISLLSSGDWVKPLTLTLYEVGCAYAIGAITGILVGFLVSRTRFATRVFEPLFSSLFAVPLIILYPLAMLFFGLEAGSKIALGSIISFFPIVLSTINGFGNVNPIYLRAASSMGASGFTLVRRVLVPAAFPVILTGLRIGFIICFLSIIGGETLGSLDGLGHQIVFNAESMDTTGMFAWIIFIVLIALALNFVVQRLEKQGEHYK